jgi:hypothetical protein
LVGLKLTRKVFEQKLDAVKMDHIVDLVVGNFSLPVRVHIELPDEYRSLRTILKGRFTLESEDITRDITKPIYNQPSIYLIRTRALGDGKFRSDYRHKYKLGLNDIHGHKIEPPGYKSAVDLAICPGDESVLSQLRHEFNIGIEWITLSDHEVVQLIFRMWGIRQVHESLSKPSSSSSMVKDDLGMSPTISVINDSNFDDESLIKLLNRFKPWVEPKSLQLYGNRLTDASIQPIINFLQKYQTIKSVDLSGNSISGIGADRLADMLVMLDLKELGISANSLIDNDSWNYLRRQALRTSTKLF